MKINTREDHGRSYLIKWLGGWSARFWIGVVAMAVACQCMAATVTIYSNDFESYTDVATSLADEADADPTGIEWEIFDDIPIAGAGPGGTGVQVVNWLSVSGSKSLLVRPASEARVHLRNTRSGSKYQLDFRIYSDRGPTSSHNFYILLLGMGTDNNGGDFIAYRGDRATNSTTLFCYDGVKSPPGWVNVGTNHLTQQWQHHRLVIDPNAQTVSVYVDDMETPRLVNSGIARSEVPMPTMMRIVNEANSADDGFFAIDDISLTVDDSIDLTTTFTEGFESYPARTSGEDDADPQGPWITTETDGTATGGGRPLAPGKVQVVDSSVVTPRSGNKSLKLEAGQRAGVTIAWGQTPETDVQITWWARVPESVQGTVANYLRMSLYGTEGGSTYAGDKALLGYGSRDGTIGDGTSLTYFTTGWLDSNIDYTPDTWEEYRLTTHNAQGRYTIIKNPSSATPEVIVDRASFIGSAPSWGPTFMAAWSSSNGTNHPPVYIDDIEIKSLVSIADPPPTPYTAVLHGDRFTNYTFIDVNGPVGKAVFDPRDNSTILFTMDAASPGGGIYRATKSGSGNWTVDPEPIVTGIDRPPGLAIETNGTIWWVHDFTPSLRRLKEPWATSAWEEVVSNFGLTSGDDDPIDVCIAPATFNGSIGKPNYIVVVDRGSDSDPNQAAYVLDPSTTSLGQTFHTEGVPPPADWWQFLVPQTPASQFGGTRLNAVSPLPQYGEVVTAGTDGRITAINADGVYREIYPATLWQDIFTGGPNPRAVGVATDPTTGRLWVADDIRDEVWSLDPDPSTQFAAPDQKELSFPLANPERPDLQLAIHDPGLSFSDDGAYMVLTDTSVANGGGRLLIFHNEPHALPVFSITSIRRTAEGVELQWQASGSATFRVQRSSSLNPPDFQDITGDLTTTSYTDTTVTGSAFYRVVAQP